jgi:hypothetical protein
MHMLPSHKDAVFRAILMVTGSTNAAAMSSASDTDSSQA